VAIRVQMPQLGATMTEGRVVKWLVREGQRICKGEPVAEIETDKIVAEVEAPVDGVLTKIVAQPDEAVEVAGLLGWIGSPGEELASLEEEPEPQQATIEAATRPARVEPGAREEPSRVRASPHARRLAQGLGVDLRHVTGSGPEGRITGQDVEAYAATVRGEGPPSAAVIHVEEVVPITGVRAVLAQRMAESAQTAAPVTLFAEADAEGLARVREELREPLGAPLGYEELLIKIAARSLSEFPYMNVRLAEEGLQRLARINVGFALHTEHGVLVPVIRDADRKGLRLIAQDVQELTRRARTGGLSPDHLAGGTFTIASLGRYGVGWFTSIINPSQCALLGIGVIAPRPAVVDGELAVRQMVCVSLTFDHRLVDGGPAARFLQRIVQLIEEPALLLV